MSETILSVRNLTANVDGIPILKGVNLEIKAGEVHAIMGRNGSVPCQKLLQGILTMKSLVAKLFIRVRILLS